MDQYNSSEKDSSSRSDNTDDDEDYEDQAAGRPQPKLNADRSVWNEQREGGWLSLDKAKHFQQGSSSSSISCSDLSPELQCKKLQFTPVMNKKLKKIEIYRYIHITPPPLLSRILMLLPTEHQVSVA
jgi:hypothetical protein